jgi:hypothetical protein
MWLLHISIDGWHYCCLFSSVTTQLSAFSFTETSKCIVLRLTKHGNQFVQFMYEDQINYVGTQIIRYEREKLIVYTVVGYY